MLQLGSVRSAAYLLDEADIAPCGHDSASLHFFVSASLRLRLARPQVEGRLFSDVVRPTDAGCNCFQPTAEKARLFKRKYYEGLNAGGLISGSKGVARLLM